MRYVVFSDLHLHAWAYGSRVIDGRNSRLLDQKKVLLQLAEYVQENDIKEVLFPGDFFHAPKVTAEVMMVAHEALAELRRHATLYWLVGNHDMASRSGDIHALSFLSNYGTVIDREFIEDFGDTHICGLPYTEDKDRLTAFLKNVPSQSTVLLHQGVSGIELNSKGFTLNELLTPDMIPDRVSMAFAGHYHSHKKVKNNLYIPGSPMQLNWGDKHEVRGWLDVDLSTNEVKHIQSNTPKFIEIKLDDMGPFDSPQDIAGNFIKIVSSQAVDSKDVKDLFLPAASIEIVVEKKQEAYKPIQKFDTFNTLFEDYIKINKLTEKQIQIGKDIVNG